MDITNSEANVKSTSRISVSDTSPSGGQITNVSQSDNSPVMMNKDGLQERGSRADELIATMGDDSYSLATEPPRMSKMKG